MTRESFLHQHYAHLLRTAARAGKTVYENELTKLSNLPHVRKEFNPSFKIRDIFFTYWHEFVDSVGPENIRHSIHKNVNAMLECRDLSKGYLMYECTKCDQYHLTGFSCNSRFCASCGHRYRDARALEIQNKLINVNHRHFVISVPFDLRPSFWRHRELFDLLFKAVNITINRAVTLSKKQKNENYQLGFISFLHTSGRGLNLHPHIHCLIAEAIVNKDGTLKKQYYFPFEKMRKTFMYILLNLMNQFFKDLGDPKIYRAFNILRNKLTNQYKHGFYTYGPPITEKKSKSSARLVAKYIARYASHPPLSEARIDHLDFDENTITWHYHPHESPDQRITETEDVLSFIAKLIRHIPDEGFHLLRYYGFYSNKSPINLDQLKQTSERQYQFLKHQLTWRLLIIKSYRFDPLLCHCGGKMILKLDSSYFPKERRRFIL